MAKFRVFKDDDWGGGKYPDETTPEDRLDLVGICERLEQAGGSMSKRTLYRARHYHERVYPGRWGLEYSRLLAAGIIRESLAPGKDPLKRGRPSIIVHLDRDVASVSTMEVFSPESGIRACLSRGVRTGRS
jgi:hypothetical protein